MFIIKTLIRIPALTKSKTIFLKSSSQLLDISCGHHSGKIFSRVFSNVVRHPENDLMSKFGRKETGLYALPVKPKVNPLHPRNALFGRKDFDKHDSRSDMFLVEAFSTAEEYRFPDFYKAVSSKPEFEEIKISDDLEGEVLAFRFYKAGQNKPSTLFVFREGTTVFWNFEQHDIKNTLKLLRAFEVKSYPDHLVQEENEIMEFTYSDGKPKILRNIIQITENESPPLAQYTFSNALALSVKLAIRESSLDYYVDNIKFISEDIRDGKKIKLSQDQVFRKTGELFNLRHHINLSSDLLDTPDFYWDRQELENLFLQACNYFNTLKRTKVINEKLSHCLELMDLLQRHLSDKHHVRLEWMIIVLIMVEVVFEFLHYFERLVDKE